MGRERTPDQSQYGEPFGDVGTEIVTFARLLTKSFSADPEASDELGAMSRTDCWDLEYMLELEHLIPLIDVPVELEGDVRQRAHDAFGALHTALPFSEAERGWLVSVWRQERLQAVEDLPVVMSNHEAQIISAGVQRAVSGRDLMRRWTAWRRGRDEFDGYDGFTQAREALQSVEEMLT